MLNGFDEVVAAPIVWPCLYYSSETACDADGDSLQTSNFENVLL